MAKRGCIAALMALFLTCLGPLQAAAVQPDEILKDATLEARARAISAGLRCLVCQNQSIDDSDAPLARDLRLIVRERITAGDDDAAVVAFVVARYGDYVLLRPPFNASTVLLWTSPLLLLLGGIWLGRKVMRGSRDETVSGPLSADERARLAVVLGSSTQDPGEDAKA